MNLDEATQRLQPGKQSLDDAYSLPDNFLEIEVKNPIVHGIGNKKYTDYEVHIKTNLPVFKVKNFSCRRRYRDFEWLRAEIKRTVRINLPKLPGKAVLRQVFTQDNGIFEDTFIEERRQGLETFINSLTSHPLVQNERALHMFLQEENINKESYIPGKVPS